MAINLKTAFAPPPELPLQGEEEIVAQFSNPFGLKVPDIKDIGDMDRYDRSLVVGKGLFDVAKLIVGLHYSGGAVDAVSGWLDKNLDFTLLEMPAVSFIATIQLYHGGDRLLTSTMSGDLFRSAKTFLSEPIKPFVMSTKPFAITKAGIGGAARFAKGLIGMGGGYLASNAFDATLGDAVEKRFGKNWRRYASTVAFFSGDIANALTLGGAARLASRTALRGITPIFGAAFLMEILVPSAQYLFYGAETNYLALLSYDAYEKRELPAWQRFFFNATFGESFMASCVTSGFGPVAWMVDGADWLLVKAGMQDNADTFASLRSVAREENNLMVKELLPIIKDALFKAAAFGAISRDLAGDVVPLFTLEELIKKGWLDKVELSDFARAGSLPFEPKELVEIVSSLRNLSLIYDDYGEAAETLKKFISWELRKGELEGGKVTVENIKDLPAFDIKGGEFVKWLGGEESVLKARRELFIRMLVIAEVELELGEGDERDLRLLSIGEEAGLITRETKVERGNIITDGRSRFNDPWLFESGALNKDGSIKDVEKLASWLTPKADKADGTGADDQDVKEREIEGKLDVFKDAYITLDELLSKGPKVSIRSLMMRQKMFEILIADTKRQLMEEMLKGSPMNRATTILPPIYYSEDEDYMTAGEFLPMDEYDFDALTRSPRLEKYLASLENELHDLNTLFVVIYLLGSDLPDENIAFNEEILDKIGDRIRKMEDVL